MLRKWILLMAITSATGCATLSEPEYPRLGALQTPPPQGEEVLNTGNPAKPSKKANLNRPLTDTVLANEPEEDPIEPATPIASSIAPLSDVFYNHYKEWRGTRYRLGGLGKGGIDCSGFVYLTFLDRLGIELPRSTHFQSQKGKEVARSQLKTGDLVFFRTGRYNHVGIYLEDGKFMHSSTKSGVRISSLSNSYWQRTYWKAKRLPLPSEMHLAQNP
jgi:cell wall-associated NlpC family hydrolase